MNPELQRRHQHDQSVFHRLLERHDAIQRTVTHIDGGLRSVTTSRDPEVVRLLHDHVPAMHRRLQEGFRLRRWDPLYVAIFDQRHRVSMDIELRADGVVVEETSDDAEVVELIRAHGRAVDGFVARGQAAAVQPSPMPGETTEISS
ncbi:hypothetical protein [Thioalkalivibrio sp. ALE11]|uniref:hypothetical protein n=1 Tax=Thioalkalivibrio sp. ALE11 TaxID=1265494 RepID=UPI0003707A98|nr:hypothetical protein [Thioalkalivibrio sp. ALE11]